MPLYAPVERAVSHVVRHAVGLCLCAVEHAFVAHAVEHAFAVRAVEHAAVEHAVVVLVCAVGHAVVVVQY